MQLVFAVSVVLFATSCSLCGCLEEAHLVPKVGIEPKYAAVDTELIMKALMAKLEHGASEADLLHKSVDKEHYSYGHETKKDIGLSEKDMMLLLMKIKELAGSKMLEEEYKKDTYHGSSEKKFLSEKGHLAGDPIKKEMSKKMFDDAAYMDKFSDKDVSLAESLYHMKIAGDVETYPNIKMESLYAKKLDEDKLLLEEALKKDESFIKKVDEMGKSLIKEESYPAIKDDDIEGYLKKVAEEEKVLYDSKVAYPEKTFGMEKTAEEKALEEWKTGHKDVFAGEEEHMLEEKFKMEAVPHVDKSIAHELNDELIKKLETSLGMDKALGAEHLAKDLHKEMGIAEGSHAYEKAKEQAHKDAHAHLSDEEMKKHIEGSFAVGTKEAHGTELAFEKGLFDEKAYGFDSKVGIGMEKSFHGIAGEEALKSKEAHAFDKTYVSEMDKAMHGAMSPAFDSKVGISIDKSLHGIAAEEALKSKEAHALDKAYGFEVDKAMHGAKAHSLGAEVGVGIDKTLHGIAGEEVLKSKEAHDVAFDFEMDKKLHGSKMAFDEEVKHSMGHDIHSTFGVEADKGFKIYEDELIKKDKAYGTDVLFHKDKEILETADDHHIHGVLKDEEAHKFHDGSIDKHFVAPKEKSHISFHDIKAKFFELLRRILHIRKCHLVTMSPGDLLSTVNCVSKSKDPLLCEKYSVCEKKMPVRVLKMSEKCQKEIIPGEIKRCSRYAPLYPSSEIPLKIFQCVAINIGELVLIEEKKEMIDFEECVRALKAESCGRFKWFRGPH